MAVEDFLEPEVAIAAAVVAAVFSPKARGVMRRGLVYGTAGVLIAGDAVTSFTRNVGQGIQQARSTKAEHNGNEGETVTKGKKARNTKESQPHEVTISEGGKAV